MLAEFISQDTSEANEFSENIVSLKSIIEKHNGKWLKEMGDGVMASFNTVSDAVQAALKIKKSCNWIFLLVYADNRLTAVRFTGITRTIREGWAGAPPPRSGRATGN